MASLNLILVTLYLVMQTVKNTKHEEFTWYMYNNIPGKHIRIAYRELSVPICNLTG